MSEEISKRILEAIKNSGFSYPELEEKTGISKSNLQRYAVGSTNKIPVDAVSQIAKATGVSAAWIMGWQEKTMTFEQKVLEITKKIPEDKREDFLKYLQASLDMLNK